MFLSIKEKKNKNKNNKNNYNNSNKTELKIFSNARGQYLHSRAKHRSNILYIVH